MLFRQVFSAFSEGGLLTGYDLAVCGECGAGYADGIPAREVFDTYYARMSKYEQSQRRGELSPIDKERFAEVADMLAPHSGRNPASLMWVAPPADCWLNCRGGASNISWVWTLRRVARPLPGGCTE